MADQHVLDLAPDLADRVQRQSRVLKHHRDFTTAQGCHRLFIGVGDVDAAEHDAALRDGARRIQNAHYCIAGDGFT